MRSVAVVIGIALAISAEALDNPFIGTWVSADGSHELAVGAVDANRFVSGWYCARAPALHVVTDFHGDGSAWGTVAARASARSLRAQIGDVDIRAAARPSEDHLQLTLRGSKRRVKHAMQRTKPANAPCGARIVPLVAGPGPDARPAPGPTVADLLAERALDRHPFIGTWVGRQIAGQVIELNVVSVTNGLVHGLYCNFWPSGWRATEMDWTVVGAIHATATRDTLRFARRDRRLRFVLDGLDRLTYVRTPAEGRPTETTLTRTGRPVCASRVLARP